MQDSQPPGTTHNCVNFTIPLASQQHRSEPALSQNMEEMQQQVYQVHDVDEQKQLLIDV